MYQKWFDGRKTARSASCRHRNRRRPECPRWLRIASRSSRRMKQDPPGTGRGTKDNDVFPAVSIEISGGRISVGTAPVDGRKPSVDLLRYQLPSPGLKTGHVGSAITVKVGTSPGGMISSVKRSRRDRSCVDRYTRRANEGSTSRSDPTRSRTKWPILVGGCGFAAPLRRKR